MEQNMGTNMGQYGTNPGMNMGQYGGNVSPYMTQNTGMNKEPNKTGNDEQGNVEFFYKKLKKEMLINRIISGVNLLMTTAILVLAIFAFVELKDFLAQVEPVIEELSKIDMEALNESLNNFNNIMETFNFDDILETFNSIDFAGINEVMEGLDVNELTETLENINEGAERLDQIGEWFENSPLNIFGLGDE